ncbi:unnamed protein product [Coffea canephora]|uniref:Uncharacterized protein n=1 Tax=Coffea canephora TaxID=49390 RepID=A0A068UU97_COFCA|nr:unnamed protein product [Coffea canephora]
MIIIRNQRDYTDQIIKGIILVIYYWALSLLLNHPEVLEKARAKLDAQVGIDRLVDEHDLSNQHILYPIIRTLFQKHFACTQQHQCLCHMSRLMTVKLRDTIFRRAQFCQLMHGQFTGTQTFGMIQQASNQSDSKASQRVVGLALGSLIQSFDWKRIGEEEIDLTEGTGVSMPKANPLEKNVF